MTYYPAHLFKSERLGFRNWKEDDLESFTALNMDPEVMEFFHAIATREKTQIFMERMRLLFLEKGYCYFAVERLDTKAFIGFIGLAEPLYTAAFTPCVDIGWRLKKSEWNNGFATEGALRCLQYAFEDLKLDRIVSTAPLVNKKSQHIMHKIGMKKQGEFDHPLLLHDERLKRCVLYAKKRI